MSQYCIREYLSEDNQKCIDLILGIQTAEFSIPISLEDQPDLKNIEAFYQKGNGNFWVARSGDNVVGTIALIDIGNQQVALRKMFVDQAFRGKTIGVAQELLNSCVKWCQEKQVKDIFLGTTAAYLAAHRFYEKNAFKLIDKAQLPANFPVMAVDSRFYVRSL